MSQRALKAIHILGSEGAMHPIDIPMSHGTPKSAEKLASSIASSLWAAPLVLVGGWLVQRALSRAPRIAMVAVSGEAATAGPKADGGEYVFATLLSEIPKGTRKLVNLQGASVLLFWYRNQLFAIENRSPAEGAFNQGFEQARFTQDFGIQCPSTETEFNMQTGAVVNWMPKNPVLRLLTPPCQPLEVFPVQIEGDEVKVQVEAGQRAYFDGGAKSSFERNNVFGIEPRMYLEDGTYIDDEGAARGAVNPSTIIVTTIAAAIVAVAGTAICLYIESVPALVVFWVVGFAATAKVVLDYTEANKRDGDA